MGNIHATSMTQPLLWSTEKETDAKTYRELVLDILPFLVFQLEEEKCMVTSFC